MDLRRSVAAPVAALAWCALCGWFAFVRGTRVPLLWCVDLGFHELGHMIMYAIPINQVLTAAMGSISQCAVPTGIALYFWFGRRDAVAGSVCMAWAATSFQDASVYIADAPYQRLQLIGGEHDWAFVLGPEHLNRLQDAHAIATVARDTGLVLLFVAVFVLVRRLLLGPVSSSASAPAAATEATPDDLFPNTSRRPSPDWDHPSTRSSSSDRR
jgi:hypothetical protein